MAYISGPIESFYSTYDFDTNTYNSYLYLGSTEDGVQLSRIQHQRMIQEDLFGDASGEGVQTGVDIQLSGVWVEVGGVGISDLQAVQMPLLDSNTDAGYPLSSLFGQLVLTPKPGTPAMYQIGGLYGLIYGGGPYTGAGLSYIFYNCGPINDLSVILHSKLSKLPITFKCLPLYGWSQGEYNSGNTTNHCWDICDTPSGCLFL